MKNIALLLPDFDEGGMPVVASNLIKELRKYVNIDLIFIKSNRPIRYDTYKSGIYQLEAESEAKIVRYLRKISTVHKLRKIRKRESYDVILSYGILAGFLNIMTSSKNSAAICTLHNIESIENKQLGISGKIFNWFLKFIFPLASKVVAISQGIQADLEKNYGLTNIVTIYNPYIFEKDKNNVTSNRQLFNDPINFVTVSRLENSKRVDRIIKALATLIDEGFNVELWILGDGSQKFNLSELTDGLGLSNKIHFLGYVDNPKEIIKKCDYFVLASENEGFPNVLIESLMVNTPIITQDIFSGPREIFENLGSVDYDEQLEHNINVYENGVLCKQILTGMRYVCVEHRIFDINTTKLERILSSDEIAMTYFSLIKHVET